LLETDDDLAIGEFGIATRMVQPKRGNRARASEEPEEQVESGATMIYKPVQQPTEAASLEDLEVEREVAILSWDGQTRRVDKRRVVLGRSRECDIQVEDANVSRRHAELRQEGATYWIVDLDSTNGIEVNGRQVKRAKLESGDTFTVGATEVTFTTERE
jgi:pSer/pThr/pTyr-binding forkhead associated (FHA) protein